MREGDPTYDEKVRLLSNLLPSHVAARVGEYACERGCYGRVPGLCETPLHVRPMSCCGQLEHVDEAFHSDLPPRGCSACQRGAMGYPARCADAGCACHRNTAITRWWSDD